MKFQRFGAGVFLLFTLLSVGTLLTQSVFLPGRSFAAVPTPDSGGGFSASAKIIDQNHIYVTVSGTYSAGSGTIDMSTASGMYYGGQVYPGQNDQNTTYTQGGQRKVGLSDTNCFAALTMDTSGEVQGTKGYNLPYSSTLSLTLHFSNWSGGTASGVDPSGTTSNSCIQPPNTPVSGDNTPLSLSPALANIGTTLTGSGFTSFNYGAFVGTDGGVNQQNNQPYYPSEAIFFRANDTQILSTQGDPAYDTGEVYAQFDEIGSSSQFKLTKGSHTNETVDPNCPDYIQLDSTNPVASDGTVQAARYHTQSGDGSQGNPCKPSTAWNVLMLINTPTNTANGTTNAAGGGETGSTTPPSNCPITTWGLDWLACPIIEGVTQTMTAVSKIITDWLVTDINGTFNFNGKSPSPDAVAYHNAWNSFRTLAISFIIIAGMVMVISEAFGFEAVSAYTIRKVLPRLVVFAILIEISWPGMQFIAQFSNDIAAWIGDVILYPFHSLNPQGLTIGQMAASWVGVILGAAILGPAGILSFLATIAVTLLVLYLTLLLRYAALITTIIVMPVALAGMILPGTRRFARIVVDEYFVVQVVIPILFAAGLALGVVMNLIISTLTQTSS